MQMLQTDRHRTANGTVPHTAWRTWTPSDERTRGKLVCSETSLRSRFSLLCGMMRCRTDDPRTSSKDCAEALPTTSTYSCSGARRSNAMTRFRMNRDALVGAYGFSLRVLKPTLTGHERRMVEATHTAHPRRTSSPSQASTGSGHAPRAVASRGCRSWQ